MKSKFKTFLSSCTVFASLVIGASATTLMTTDQGNYDCYGFHDSTDTNYQVGFDYPNYQTYNNFFVFDTSGLCDTPGGTANVSSATVRIKMENYGFTSAQLSETWELFSVESNISDVLSSSPSDINGPGFGIYQDLGSGTSYGVASLSESQEGTYIEVSLNAAGLAAIEASIAGDGVFAFGGALTSNNFGQELAFLNSSLSNNVELIVEHQCVPEPSSVLLLGLGGLGLAIRRKRS